MKTFVRHVSMPAYGYQRALIDPECGLMELREVSFALDPAGLRRVAAFLQECADRIDSGEFRSDHTHIEEIDRLWREENPELDIIV